MLLPLHNRMSAPGMQALMSSRPTDKATMKTQMDGLEEALQLATTSLFNVAKKMTGKNQTEPTSAQKKMTGMSALLACVPDWRRDSTAKNRGRDLKPMIQAITLEVVLVEKYREDLIESGVLVAVLREVLENTLQGCDRVSQKLLVPGASASSGGQVATVGMKKRPIFWDGIPLPEKTADNDKLVADELNVQHTRTKKRLESEARDRDMVKKIIASCTSVSIARVNLGTHSEIAVEVADAVNALIKVSCARI